MAARRLIAVILVLLFLSSLAAALAPVERQSETSTTTTEPVTEPVAAQGKVIRATLDGAAKRPQRIPARVGDQLRLRVKSDRVATVELVGLGPTEDVDPVAPALFDVLLSEQGRYEVRELGGRREVYGTIVVSRPAQKGRDREKAPARS